MKRLLALLTAAVLTAALPMTAYAGGGGGGGGGKNKAANAEPLTVESASIENDALISAEDTITLVFSKNVCDASVREANTGFVLLTNGEDQEVAVEVILTDDQIEPDKKNDMTIAPVEPLEPGEYTLTVKAGVAAKSGSVTKEDYTLTFVVEAPPEETTEPTPVETEPVTEPETEATEAPTEETQAPAAPQTQSSSTGIVVAVAVVAVGAAAFFLLKKKH